MQKIVVILVAFVRKIILSRAPLQLENITLRQQVAVLKRERLRPWLQIGEADFQRANLQGAYLRDAGLLLWGAAFVSSAIF